MVKNFITKTKTNKKFLVLNKSKKGGGDELQIRATIHVMCMVTGKTKFQFQTVSETKTESPLPRIQGW